MKGLGWYRWLTPAAAVALSISGASAQLKPWPDQQPQAQPQQAWPGDNQPAASGGAQPAAIQPAPIAPMAPSAAPMMAPPGMGPPPGSGGQNPCMSEFMRLRGDVDKAGKITKSVSDRKGSREEFCKAVTGLHNAQAKWVKYATSNASTCHIPPDILGQLKTGEGNLAKMRQTVCNGGGVAGPAAPSLAEALGTATMPVTEDATAKKRGGTLDTLTGQTIR